MSASQTARVLAHLREHPEGITQLDAYRLGMGTRLAARISDAREALRNGERIVTLTEPHDGGTHARYVLVAQHRTFASVDDWDRFAGSEHQRHGHARRDEPVTGCEWCVRFAAVDQAWRTAPEPESLPLWDCGDAS